MTRASTGRIVAGLSLVAALGAGAVGLAQGAPETSTAGDAGPSSGATSSTTTTAASTTSAAPTTAAAPTGIATTAAADAVRPDAPAAHANSGPLRVVALGDSVPAGDQCPHCTTYVTQVARRLAAAQGRRAVVDNEASGGETTAHVLQDLEDPAVRASIARADLVIVQVGANDLDATIAHDPSCRGKTGVRGCFGDSLDTLHARLTEIVQEVDTLQRPAHGEIEVAGYWNVFKAGDVADQLGDTYSAVSTDLTRQANAAIAEVARDEGVVYVDAATPFGGHTAEADPTHLLTPDGDHPNQRGHDALADAFVAALGGESATL